MCGRYVLSTPPEQIAALFEIAGGWGGMPRDWRPRYNIAPSQRVAVVRAGEAGRVLDMMKWGLVPRWARSPDEGPAPINARSETAAQKPTFRHAMKQGRCLIPCDGFYEWKKIGEKAKQPMFVRHRGGGPFAMAGLWERWKPRENGDEELLSCAVLTTEANELMKPIPDRMPAIVPKEQWGPWLDPGVTDAENVGGVLRPFASDAMETWPVGRAVNRPAAEGSGLIERVDEIGPEGGVGGLW